MLLLSLQRLPLAADRTLSPLKMENWEYSKSNWSVLGN